MFPIIRAGKFLQSLHARIWHRNPRSMAAVEASRFANMTEMGNPGKALELQHLWLDDRGRPSRPTKFYATLFEGLGDVGQVQSSTIKEAAVVQVRRGDVVENTDYVVQVRPSRRCSWSCTGRSSPVPLASRGRSCLESCELYFRPLHCPWPDVQEVLLPQRSCRLPPPNLHVKAPSLSASIGE